MFTFGNFLSHSADKRANVAARKKEGIVTTNIHAIESATNKMWKTFNDFVTISFINFYLWSVNMHFCGVQHLARTDIESGRWQCQLLRRVENF